MIIIFNVSLLILSFYLLAVICDRYFVNSLDAIADGDTDVKPANEDFFSPRYFDHATVKARREDLEAIISEWYMDNPFIYVEIKAVR